MRTLIVEDDFTCRLLLQHLLRKYGPSDVAVTGKEALAAVLQAIESGERYDLICMDIMMPEMDGQEALRGLRAIEEAHGLNFGRGAKVLMTTAVQDSENVMHAYKEQCDGYLFKPIDKAKLIKNLRDLRLIEDEAGEPTVTTSG